MNVRSLLISLLVSLVLFSIQIIVFSLLRKRFREIYEPKAFSVPQQMRVTPPPSKIFAWIPATLKQPLESVKQNSGLDAYFLLRLIIFLLLLNCGIAAIMAPVLLPLHILGGGTAATAWLAKLSISNISEENNRFLTAHLVLCIFTVTSCLAAIYFELQTYYYIRAKYTVEDHAPLSSATLLVKGLYPEFRTHAAVQSFFDGVPGKIVRIWFNRDYSELSNLVSQQDAVLRRLEYLETWLIKKCQKNSSQPSEPPGEEVIETGPRWRSFITESKASFWTKYQLNTLAWFKSELSRLNSQVYLLQSQEGMFEPVNSCFVQFESRVACFMAYRSIHTSHGRDKMTLGVSYTDQVYPSDVVWSNLSKPTCLERVLHVTSALLDYTLIFGWAIPIALVSMVTQLETLSQLVPELQWLLQFPRVSRMMSSIVSPLALSWLTSQVPHIFRALARLKGYPTQALIEKDVQKYYFLFLFVQLFLIVTLATGLPTLIVRMLVNTSEGAISLASSLPRATNFFMSYLIASCFMTSGNALLRIETLSRRAWQGLWHVSPRARLKVFLHFSSIPWGSVFPLLTNVCAISLTYALISPVILFCAVIGYCLLFISYKYCILYCHVPKSNSDGEYYPRALFQLLSGVYCQELSLLGTLLLRNLLVHAMIMAGLIALTIFANYYLTCMSLDLDVRMPLASQVQSPSSSMTSSTFVESGDFLTSPSTADVGDQLHILFHNLEYNFSKLSEHQRSFISDKLYEHPVLRRQRPCVWLPRDSNGVAKDEVQQLQTDFSDMRASCVGADLTDKGQIVLRRCPPDFDLRDLMRT
ncbi:Uncharacterized protein RSN1 [Wickerhamiella sorbophila]|uniref:Uncharacterized protein RSN1 n=1 Tax=Wickerhamiella sorbophila TaxID=45607 RepID=A0A2T0FPI9_9ASCO|nr:Uncharacterized protein RSN1 [Wickerhamiella sorbophila]PRT56879.1 Uncharacterized protein RSN1 [Wickerhamiella sorbophila]